MIIGCSAIITINQNLLILNCLSIGGRHSELSGFGVEIICYMHKRGMNNLSERYNFLIEDLPKDPAKEFDFLIKRGLEASYRQDAYSCDVCGWHGYKVELDTQTDYLRDDFKIRQYHYYVCPDCKYPGITHAVKTVTIERRRIRPSVFFMQPNGSIPGLEKVEE